MAKRSRRYRELSKLVDRQKSYTLEEALELVQKLATAKFPETLEFVVRLNVNPKKADQNLRGTLTLPHGTGKKVRVLVIAKGDKAKEAEEAGADYVGDKELIEKIQKESWFDYDVVITTPDMMKEVAKLGRLLGPRGLMPSPKTGTVTQDVGAAVREFKKGKVEYRNDPYGNIHLPVGKVGENGFTTEQLLENIKAVISTLLRIRPATVKGQYVLSAFLSPTMGPSVRLDLNDLISKVK
jgi:large subunit ribosomal protein L1